MKKLLYTVLFALCPLLLIAQAPDTLWTMVYGGTAWDYGALVQPTADGGYIITGFTGSFGSGSSDVWLLKTDSLGDTLWTRTYGDSAYDQSYSVRQTTDGGYIITGETSSYGAGDYDVYLIKTDSLGDTLWTRTFGSSGYDGGNSVQQTTDGSYIITGATQYGAGYYDVYLIKTDSLGDTLWTRTFGGADWDEGVSVQQTTDEGYIITGFSSGDVYLIKTDSFGDTLWTRKFGGAYWDYGESVQQTTDGGYIITGWTASYGAGIYDIYLIKVDFRGDTLWTRTFGGSIADFGESVQQTTDGGYIIAGITYSFGAGESDVYLIKTDSFGDTLWTRTFGGSAYDGANSVHQTSDGGYILVGETESYGAGSGDVYLLKIAPETGVEEEKIIRSGKGQGIFSPTIFSGPLLLPEGESYRVFDITGRAVVPDHIKPGVYFVEIDGVITQKVVKIR